jgi:hypothetical protein
VGRTSKLDSKYASGCGEDQAALPKPDFPVGLLNPGVKVVVTKKSLLQTFRHGEAEQKRLKRRGRGLDLKRTGLIFIDGLGSPYMIGVKLVERLSSPYMIGSKLVHIAAITEEICLCPCYKGLLGVIISLRVLQVRLPL